MDLVKVLKEAFDQLIKDILPLVVAGLIVVLLSVITLGVLGGPLSAGLLRMILLRLRGGPAPEVADVFYFERFGSYVLAFYALVILVAIGTMLLIVPGLYLATIWIYVLPLMVDRGLNLSDALSESKRMVQDGGLGTHFGLVVILALLGAALNTLTKGIGSLLITPFAAIAVLLAYRIHGEGVAIGEGGDPASAPGDSAHGDESDNPGDRG